jgi:heme a synthase
MKRELTFARAHERVVRIWLLAVATLVFALVLVGGATRLTESGLSIVEWKPVTGAWPPLTAAEWQAEFDKYKMIPQFALNRGMSVADFQFIYWWEWTHRLLGRVTGVLFLVPFLWFLWRGWIDARLGWRLGLIFALGALQGAVGWWMVASGLSERVEVSQYRLAVHLLLACAIFAAVLATAVRAGDGPVVTAPARVRIMAGALVGLVLAQIYFGALVAGLRAGLVYNTWPRIDGEFLPAAAQLLFDSPAWRNFFENPLTVQFDHRMVAYALWLLAMLHLLDTSRARGGALPGALALAAAMTIQVALGIVTLLHQAGIVFALLHQGMALMTLAIAVIHAARLAKARPMQVAIA